MEYDRILLEMLDRIKKLEEKVEKLEKAASPSETAAVCKTSNKYRHLSTHLAKSTSPVRLSFQEIEQIVGFRLPPSAYSYREFWANTKSHSIALSWMGVGFKTVEVSLEEEYVVFEN